MNTQLIELNQLSMITKGLKWFSGLVIGVLATGWCLEQPAYSQQATVPNASTLEVTKNRLSFDPKSCPVDEVTFPWNPKFDYGHLEILGQENGHCRFKLMEGNIMNYSTYLCKIPANSGSVVISSGSPVKTSFSLNECELIEYGKISL